MIPPPIQVIPMHRLACLTALVAALLAAALPARAADADLQAWTLLTAQGHVSERVRLYAELQPRVALSPGAFFDRLLVRGAVGWDLRRDVTVWLGYAWTPTFPGGFRDEQRPFQQLTVGEALAGGRLLNRTRLEQRLVAGDDLSLRLRHMVRYARPMAEGSPWLLAAYDELFWNLNAPERGARQGFDRNRLFVGVNRVAGGVTLEAGYLLEVSRRPEPKPLLLRSGVVLGAAWNLP
jgi:hypothetical protein